MAVGQALNLRVLLEGVEIPAISAMTQYGVRQPATAHIEVITTPSVRKLKPRTLVHAFYLDEQSGPNGEDVDRLLYHGDLVGFAANKATSGRSTVLIFIDWTGYWDCARRYHYDLMSLDSQVLITGAFTGAKKLGSDPLFGPSATLGGLLKQKCRTYPELSGLLSNVLRVMESIGGYQEGDNKTRGISDFFTQAQLRLKFYQQVGVPPGDNTAARLLDSEQFYKWVRNLVGQGGSQYTLRQVIEGLLGVVFYNYVTNPVPYYKEAPSRTVTKKGRTEAAKPAVLKRVEAALKAIERARTNYSKVLEIGPTTVEFDAGFASGDEDVDSDKHPQQWNLLQEACTRVEKFNGKYDDLKNHGVSGEGDANFTHFLGADAEYPLSGAETAYKKFLSQFSTGRSWEKSYSVPGDRMLTVLMVPDIFMAPPPRCNVIFPEHYERLQDNRNYLSEPTRLMISTQTTFLGEDVSSLGLGKQYYFAPDIRDTNGKPIRKQALQARSFFMDHEVFTGPIPDVRYFPDIRTFDPILGVEGDSMLTSSHAQQSAQVEKERGAADPIPYLQHTANFMLVQARYGARTAMVPSRFNPRVVAGLPALVINQHEPGADGKVQPQILGVPMTIQHVVGQAGGYSQFSLAYVREHREDADMFQSKTRKTKQVRKRIKYIGTGQDVVIPRFRGKVVAFDPTPVTGYQPNSVTSGPPPDGMLDVNQEETLGRALSGEITPNQLIKVNRGTTERMELFPVSGEKPGATSSQYDLVREGTAQTPGFANFDAETLNSIPGIVTEERVMEVPVGDEIQFPFEDQVRPPWLSPIYCNTRIGPEVYQELIGVGSILDAATVKKMVDSTFKALDSLGTTPAVDNAKAAYVRTHPGTDPSKVVVAEQKDETTVADCVEDVVIQYRAVKDLGSADDVEAFIRRFTNRPIATMEQVLGTADLIADTDTGKVVQGKAGFHSFACGPYSNFDLLLPKGAKLSSDLTGKGDKAPEARADPRNARWLAVVDYMTDLEGDRAFGA